VISILEGKKIAFEAIDISDPTREEDKKFMQQHGKPAGNDKVPMPPQIFSDEDYCGVCITCCRSLGFVKRFCNCNCKVILLFEV